MAPRPATPMQDIIETTIIDIQKEQPEYSTTKTHSAVADQPNAQRRVADQAVERFTLTLSLYTAIYNKIQIPLTPSTTSRFRLLPQELGLIELAKQEELAARSPAPTPPSDPPTIPIPPDNPEHPPPFIPSATSLLSALGKQPPASHDLVHHTGASPQAALDGRCWEMALSEFTSSQRDEINAFEKRMRAVITGWRIFTTLGGPIGVGPRSLFAEEGWSYEVHILKGGKVPYILAKNTWDDEIGNDGGLVQYQLIGEAYVHGIMDGEVHSRMALGEKWAEYKKIRLV